MNLSSINLVNDSKLIKQYEEETDKFEGGDRYPYPYVFKPPEHPDDLALAPRAQLRQPPKKKDKEEKFFNLRMCLSSSLMISSWESN